RDGRGNDLLCSRYLADDRAEAREEQRGYVEHTSAIKLADFIRHLFGVLERKLPHAFELDGLDDKRRVEPLKLVVALPPHAQDLPLLAVSEKAIDVLAGKPHDGRIEGAAQSTLGGADDEQVNRVLAGADH